MSIPAERDDVKRPRLITEDPEAPRPTLSRAESMSPPRVEEEEPPPRYRTFLSRHQDDEPRVALSRAESMSPPQVLEEEEEPPRYRHPARAIPFRDDELMMMEEEEEAGGVYVEDDDKPEHAVPRAFCASAPGPPSTLDARATCAAAAQFLAQPKLPVVGISSILACVSLFYPLMSAAAQDEMRAAFGFEDVKELECLRDPCRMSVLAMARHLTDALPSAPKEALERSGSLLVYDVDRAPSVADEINAAVGDVVSGACRAVSGKDLLSGVVAVSAECFRIRWESKCDALFGRAAFAASAVGFFVGGRRRKMPYFSASVDLGGDDGVVHVHGVEFVGKPAYLGGARRSMVLVQPTPESRAAGAGADAAARAYAQLAGNVPWEPVADVDVAFPRFKVTSEMQDVTPALRALLPTSCDEEGRAFEELLGLGFCMGVRHFASMEADEAGCVVRAVTSGDVYRSVPALPPKKTFVADDEFVAMVMRHKGKGGGATHLEEPSFVARVTAAHLTPSAASDKAWDKRWA